MTYAMVVTLIQHTDYNTLHHCIVTILIARYVFHESVGNRLLRFNSCCIGAAKKKIVHFG